MISKDFSERFDNNLLQKINETCGRQQMLLESGKRELDKLREDSRKHIAQLASAREKLSAENVLKPTKSRSQPVPFQTAKQKEDDTLAQLVKKQKMELDDLNKRILFLQTQLEGTQGLELELKTLKSFGAKHDDLRVKRDNFKERKEGIEELADALKVYEQRFLTEVHEARQALIDVFKELSSPYIGIKKVGELDPFPFLKACKQKYPGEIADVKAVELCSLWEANLQDPSWRPFTTCLSDGVTKEFVDKEDERLMKLKEEWGEDVYVAVLNAMRELHEYNPCERLPITELWNYRLDKKATLREGVEFIVEKWRASKRRKRSMP